MNGEAIGPTLRTLRPRSSLNSRWTDRARLRPCRAGRVFQQMVESLQVIPRTTQTRKPTLYRESNEQLVRESRRSFKLFYAWLPPLFVVAGSD